MFGEAISLQDLRSWARNTTLKPAPRKGYSQSEDIAQAVGRRSLGSWQAITGASLVIIGKSLGHKSADATMIYARLNTDPVRASVSAATSAMLEAAGVKNSANVLSLRAVK